MRRYGYRPQKIEFYVGQRIAWEANGQLWYW